MKKSELKETIKEILSTLTLERFKVIDTKTGDIIDTDLPKKIAQRLANKKKEWTIYPDKKESTIAKIAKTLDESTKKDCNCGCHSCENVGNPGVVLNESLVKKDILSGNLRYHVDNKLPLTENTFRYGSQSFINLWAEARALYLREMIHVNELDKEILEETDLGNYGLYEGKKVPLDMPLEESDKKKNPTLNKPTRSKSGKKAYMVYVKDPKTKKIKLVRFGSGGLRAKINNAQARQAFAKRHKCSEKKDKTKASYWSCRLPRYASLLGIKSSFSGYW